MGQQETETGKGTEMENTQRKGMVVARNRKGEKENTPVSITPRRKTKKPILGTLDFPSVKLTQK